MDYNLEKAIADYTREAFQTARRSANSQVNEPVPEPEPAPEPIPEPAPKSEPKPVPKAEPKPVFEKTPEPVQEPIPEPVFEEVPEPEIFEDILFDEIAEIVETTGENQGNAQTGKPVEPIESEETLPNFEDYIDRSWEKSPNPPKSQKK